MQIVYAILNVKRGTLDDVLVSLSTIKNVTESHGINDEQIIIKTVGESLLEIGTALVSIREIIGVTGSKTLPVVAGVH